MTTKNTINADSPENNIVLIVDDKPTNLEIVENYLKESDFTTLIATSGESALKRISYIQPDMILLDVLMPGIDGYETCRILKSNEKFKDIPVIFMTGLADAEHKVKGFAEGAVDYITKPVQKEELLARISTHLKIQRYHKHLEEEVRKRTIEIEKRTIQLKEELAERIQAENALRQSEERVHSLVRNIPGVSYRSAYDQYYTIKFISAAIETLSGYPVTDFIDNAVRSYLSIIHPSDRQKVWNTITEGVEKKKSFSIEYRIIVLDKAIRWVYEKGQGIFDEQGAIRCIDGVIVDITERKKAEEELKHLRNYLSNIINSMPSVLIGVDVNSRVTQWNKTAEQTTGISADDAHGQILSQVFPQMISEIEKISESIRTRITIQEQKKPRMKQDETCYEDITIYPLIVNGVEGAVIRVDDVTERVRIEDAKRKDAVGRRTGGGHGARDQQSFGRHDANR